MSDESSTSGASERTRERPRSSGPVANPRRLRLGRDGRPLPLTARDEDVRPA
ncbi:hypothetical protein GCM10027446_32540 [Angustibacter peucedani]